MAYTTAVTDRTQTDITNRTSKAFLNVADWTRIYTNAQLTASYGELVKGSYIVFTPIAPATTTTWPSVTDLNTLLANINRIRTAFLTNLPSLTAVKEDWTAGQGSIAPNYTHVNQWEANVDAVWVYINGAALTSLTMTGNLTITTGNRNIYIDFVDAGNFDIDLQGSAELHIL